MSLHSAALQLLEAVGSDPAEVFGSAQRRRARRWLNGRLQHDRTRHDEGLALRLIRNGRIGFAASSAPVNPEILVEQARSSAASGPLLPLTFGGKRDRDPLPSAAIDDARIDEVVEDLTARVLERYPKVTVTIQAEQQDQTRAIRTTAGADHQETTASAMLHMTVSRAGDSEILDLNRSEPFPLGDESVNELAEWFINRLAWTRRSADQPGDSTPVILTPRAFASLLVLPLAEALSGPSLIDGTSPLLHRFGEQVTSPGLTITDDPASPGAPRTRAVDDEGIPAARYTLIESGVVRAAALDLISAAKLGRSPTGNAWRHSWSEAPEARPATLVVPAGDRSLASLLAEWPVAILVDDVASEWLSDLASGVVSASAYLAYRVERGEIVGRVRDLALRASLDDLLAGPLVLTRERSWVEDRAVLPYVCAAAMRASHEGES